MFIFLWVCSSGSYGNFYLYLPKSTESVSSFWIMYMSRSMRPVSNTYINHPRILFLFWTLVCQDKMRRVEMRSVCSFKASVNSSCSCRSAIASRVSPCSFSNSTLAPLLNNPIISSEPRVLMGTRRRYRERCNDGGTCFSSFNASKFAL